MYKHLTPEVQHNIFMHTINHSADNLERIYIYILMFNKFPKSAITQAPRLLEMLAEGMKTEPDLYQRILVEEVLPMIQNKPRNFRQIWPADFIPVPWSFICGK